MRNIANLLIIDGGAVKTSEEGLVEGLGIVFGSEEEPDQSSQRDFFTKDSFVRKKDTFDVPLYYEHGFGAIDVEIGEATLTKTDSGWKAVAKIDTSDELGKKVYEAVKEKPHGFSTGALQHLVKREARQNNTNFLKQWVVGELSLTERPAERKAVVESVKSVDGEIIKEDAWDTMEEKIEITLLDKEANAIWTSAGDVKQLDGLTPYFIELKSVSGSVRYQVYMYDEEGKGGTEIQVYEWGGVEGFITHLQNVINTAALNVKSEPQKEEGFEEKVNSLIEKALSDKLSQKMSCEDTEDEDCDPETGECDKEDEMKNASELEKEIADLKSELSDRDDALTKAKEEIARLEILAGAKETITKNKGK